MTRKLILCAVILALFVPAAYAKKEKTITYKDSVLADGKYGFEMVVTKNWKVKGFNEPSLERVFLEKKNYSVNTDIKTYGGDYTIPTVLVFAQEFNGTVADFEALLRKSLDEHKSDNEIIGKLGLLMDSELVLAGDSVIDSLPVRQLILRRNYKRVLSADAYGRSGQSSGENRKVHQ